MGGSLAPRSFPWPSTIGGSQAVSPLVKATAPSAVTSTSPYGGSAQPDELPASPTQAPQGTLAPVAPIARMNPIARLNPIRPIAGGLRAPSAFYG